MPLSMLILSVELSRIKKIEAIINMPAPQDKPGVQMLLGMVNYLAKFIQGMKCSRTVNHQDAFEKIKEILSTDRVLGYYDITKPVVLQTDVSNNGLGAVLLQTGFPVP